MIKVDNVQVYGINRSVYSIRNAMNSWEKSDTIAPYGIESSLGENDYELAIKLCKAGTDHRKFLRMIQVYMNIVAPLYWWKEFDTYKVGTVANSCSTMHNLTDHKFTLNDFSHDHLIAVEGDSDDKIDYDNCSSKHILRTYVDAINEIRDKFLKTKDKKYWYQIIQLLPSSYNQGRTVSLNYEVLRNMYNARKKHKLDEWQSFCRILFQLPYSSFITGDDEY